MTYASDPLLESQRLHPLTLLHRLLLGIPPLVFLLLPALRRPEPDAWFSIVTSVVYGLLALPLIVLRYLRFRYRITPREIVIESGVFTRKHRSIPIEKIQNIEIEQKLLPRVLGTAKVKIETAGSAKTEGVIEFVALDRAYQIQRVVRSYQTDRPIPGAAAPSEDDGTERAVAAATGQETAPPALFSMTPPRILLTGMLRFSLLYIAVAFSLLQAYNPDTDEIERWLTSGWLKPLADLGMAFPWWLLTLGAVLVAGFLSWITGILVTVNRYYHYTLWQDHRRLHKRQGLLTLSEGTIPLKKVQALIVRANLLMRTFSWYRLELQTMGIESSQKGDQVAVPLGRIDEIEYVGGHIYPFRTPDSFRQVSRLTIRRTFIRYLVGLLVIVGPAAAFRIEALAGLAAIPLLFYLAVLHYRYHGYALEDRYLVVRRGVIQQRMWVLPIEKFQVFYVTDNLFQRRLGLRSLHIDTAGAGGMASPDIVDLPREEAQALVETLYARFQAHFAPAAPASRPGSDAPFTSR